MTQYSKVNKILILIVLLLTMVSIINLIVYGYINYIYKQPYNDSIKFKYQNSIKKVEYLMPYFENDIYYNQLESSLYFYNNNNNLSSDFFAKGITTEYLNSVFEITPTNYLQVDDNVYKIPIYGNCKYMLISLNYNPNNEYNGDFFNNINNFEYCVNYE